MNLDTESWKEFYISRTKDHPGLFDIENCKCGSAGNLDDGNEINYIGAKKNDNGVMRKVIRDENLVSKGNGILFICDGEGSVGYTNYMDKDFIGSTTTSIGYDEALNPVRALFLVTILDKERFKYSYGRKYRAHLNEATIKLPVKKKDNGDYFNDLTKKYSFEGYIPDWEYMEKYIKSLNHKPLSTSNRGGCASLTLGVENWKPFKVNELFEVRYGINMELNTCIEAEDDDFNGINFVARTESNNGVSARVKPIEGKDPQPAGLITCAGGGSVLSTFLQEAPFYSGRDLYLLIPLKPMSKPVKLFCITVIKANKYRYSYGRQANITLPYLELMLPATIEGQPDFDFMENYMRSLPYGDRL